MCLDEAIEHCKDVAETCNNASCAADHEQLAAWLQELKDYRNNERGTGALLMVGGGEFQDTVRTARRLGMERFLYSREWAGLQKGWQICWGVEMTSAYLRERNERIFQKEQMQGRSGGKACQMESNI